MHDGRPHRAYPTKKDRRNTSFEEACKRIGMMVMGRTVTEITVYCDDEVFCRWAQQKAEVTA